MIDECREECPSYIFTIQWRDESIVIKLLEHISNWHVYIGRSKYLLTYGSIDLDNKDLDNFIKLLETYK